MKLSVLELMRCPVGGGSLDAVVTAQDGAEVREGRLECASCRASDPIRRSAPDQELAAA
jgi:uncharacterized protein YbaR (Trm112 family)